MKIGVKPKSYNDIIYFDLDALADGTDKELFINNIINSAKTGGENGVDLIIQPNKKETKTEIPEAI